MKPITRIVGAVALALAMAVGVAVPATASPWYRWPHRAGQHQHAVFVQTDNPAGNAIVVYDRSRDGTLRRAGTYPTGGRGGVLAGSVVDHLASQGSLAYDRAHRLLYAVNAGSDTITVFTVRGDRLVRRQVVSSGGNFPVSVAVHDHLVYVLDARDGGALQGYLRLGGYLVQVPSWHRSLGLDPTAMPEFVNTPGQVAFSPDGAHLVVTTKANGNDIDVFQVGRFGALSADPVVTSDPGGVPFAVTFDRHGRLALAEAGTNSVATFAIHPDGQLSLLARAATGQMATCWIVGTHHTLYVSNAGSATESGYRVEHAGTLTGLGTTGTDAGTVDAAVSMGGRYLYVQTGAMGIVDEFRVHRDGSLVEIGSVLVPGSVGGEGIAVS